MTQRESIPMWFGTMSLASRIQRAQERMRAEGVAAIVRRIPEGPRRENTLDTFRRYCAGRAIPAHIYPFHRLVLARLENQSGRGIPILCASNVDLDDVR